MAEQDPRYAERMFPTTAEHGIAGPTGPCARSKLQFRGYHRPGWPSRTRSPLLKQLEE